jgi:hypothetical protein
LIDPLTGDDREKPVSLGPEFAMKGIQDAILVEQTLVFRNTNNQFYWISNIQNPVANKFDSVPQLINQTISDYLIIPKGTKGSSAMELLVADPNEGFWVISENKKSV